MAWQDFKNEFRLLWVFYVIKFLVGAAAFVVPVWVIYFRGIGFSFSQISVILSISLIAPLIFEVPTGAIADLYGRKICVALSYFIGGLLFIAVPFTQSFWVIVALFFAFYASGTLASGADDAWLVDYLKHKKRSELVHTAFARLLSFGNAGGIIAFSLSGPLVLLFDLKWLWVLQGVVFLIVGLITAVWGREHFERRKIKINTALKEAGKEAKGSIKYTFGHPVLLYLIIAIFFMMFYNIGEVLWQPFLMQLGLPIYYLGPLFAVAAASGFIIPLFSMRYLKKMKTEKRALILSEVATGLLLVSIAFVISPLAGALVFIALNMMWGLARPIGRSYFQKYVPSETRATISSLQSLVASIGGAIAILMAGFLADAIGLRMTFVALTVFVIPVVIAYSLIKER